MRLLPKPLTQRLEAMAAQAFLALAQALPVDGASAMGGWLGRTIGPRLKTSRVARRNLARIMPHLTDPQISAIITEVWDNLGRVAAEMPHLDWLVTNRLTVDGLPLLHQMQASGRPILVIGGHLGNWEMGPSLAQREQLDLTLVYRAANNPWVEKLYRRFRPGRQIQKGPEGAKEILTVLKNGGAIGMLVDQKMNDGIAVPFMGVPAMTAPAMGRFAKKFDCLVLSCRIQRTGGAHFHVTLRPFDTSGDAAQIMERANTLLGDWIAEDPGQWLWLHRRWPDQG